MLILLIKMSGLDNERLHDSQVHTRVYRKDQKRKWTFSCLRWSESQSRELGKMWPLPSHCLALQPVGLGQGNGGLPLEGILPRLTVAGLSCPLPRHSGLLNVHTHTYIYTQNQIDSVHALSGPGHVWKSLQSSRLLSPFKKLVSQICPKNHSLFTLLPSLQPGSCWGMWDA